MRNTILISIAAAVAIALGLGFRTFKHASEPASTPPAIANATVLQVPRAVPDFELKDSEKQPFTRDRLMGGWHLLYFGYTRCPDVCPNTLAMLHAVNDKLRRVPQFQPPNVVFVSVDPKRDKPRQLGAYVQYFDAGFLAVTGKIDELKKLTDALYVPFSYIPIGKSKDNDYSVDHSGSVILLNPQAQAVAYFSPPQTVDVLASDIQLLMQAHG